MEFENALPLPINFTVGDNKYENTKDRFPRRFTIFVPLESIDALCNHLQALKEDQSRHKDGKVFDMRENTRVEVRGVYLSANGKKNTFDKDEEDYGAYGSVNPRMHPNAKPTLPPQEEDSQTDYDMNWDSKIPF
tara:strand:+ start:274 stop:675 length:402 start_codon:yes stop_codon:yes gene_type:complete